MKNKRNLPCRRVEKVARMKQGDPLSYDVVPHNRGQRRAFARELQRMKRSTPQGGKR